MKRSLKSLLAILVSFIMSLVLTVPTFAIHTTDEFAVDHGVLMREVQIDPYDCFQAEQIISKYHVQPETAQTIRMYVQSCMDGSGDIEKITLTIPALTTNRASGDGTRTYKGYGNKTYYEEIITAEYDSPITEVGGGLWENYVTDTVKAVGEYAINSAINTLTKGTWAISKLFAPNAVPSDHSVLHSAQLHETKTAKHTYVVEDGQYYFGSLVQRSSGRFQNFILDEDTHRTEIGKDSVLSPIQTPNYNSPDEKAYYGYVSSGWVETISGYEYHGVHFNFVGA